MDCLSRQLEQFENTKEGTLSEVCKSKMDRQYNSRYQKYVNQRWTGNTIAAIRSM
jgi:hypothetical protein